MHTVNGPLESMIAGMLGVKEASVRIRSFRRALPRRRATGATAPAAAAPAAPAAPAAAPAVASPLETASPTPPPQEGGGPGFFGQLISAALPLGMIAAPLISGHDEMKANAQQQYYPY
jgi:hypothetical protein